jgi:cyclopropane fatty-acyl-phospholipid synthase-like methyltransferase
MKDSSIEQPVIDRSYYNRDYYVKHLDRLGKRDRFTKVKVSRVLALLSPKKDERIIDLGSGVGTMMVLLASSGACMIGMDYSPDSLKLARINFGREVPDRIFRGLCCDGRDIAMRNASIDGIMAVDFTEHLDDETLLPTIHEVFRILRKGGRFVIYTPCKTHLFERLKKHNIILKRDKSHIGMRTMKEYRAMLMQCGFVIQKAYFSPTDIPVFNIIEHCAMHFPLIGDFAKRRICICAVK